MDDLVLYKLDVRRNTLPIKHCLKGLETRLGASVSLRNAHVLLIGLSQAELTACHRLLFRLGVAAGHCHALLPDQQEALCNVNDTLLDIAIENMVHMLAPAKIVDVYSGEQFFPLVDGPRKVMNHKPTLAFVSPLPPQMTGIANYSAELLPYLAVYFNVTLVVDQPVMDNWLQKDFACLSADEFLRCAASFDYTLYQVGNSLYHAYQFELLRYCPGMVVMHDYYLFDAMWWLNESGLRTDALTHQLYSDHGYPALLAQQQAAEKGRGAEQYPVNGIVTREACGIIYHSSYAKSLADYWQQGAKEPTYLIPHLRKICQKVDKQAARFALGVADHEIVIASFGGVNPKKLSHLLVGVFLGNQLEGNVSLGTVSHQSLRLVLVGAQHSGEYGYQIEREIKQHRFGNSITITGYASAERYEQWLHAADIAVQLRTQSRGETSGAILDVMAHGMALIANAHGSGAELPDDSYWQLPDDKEDRIAELLRQALLELISDDEKRTELGEAARNYVASRLAPKRIARQYRDAIVSAPLKSPRYRYERFVDQIAAYSPLQEKLNDTAELKKLTKILSEIDTTPTEQKPRLLFDVSTIAWEDLKTGIERVTRRIADYLLRHPPAGWRVELIRWGGDDFYLARGFASEQLGIAPVGPDLPIEARPGDRYVSVEWAPPLLKQASHIMHRMRAKGVRFYFTVHDLLPLTLPECFPPHIPDTMREWFNAISSLADGITCVSGHVASEVEKELDDLDLMSYRPWVKPFHLGADFQTVDAQASSKVLKPEEKLLQRSLATQNGPTLLMVGTIEPRKGHRQVLEALEVCWQKGAEINLVIVGKPGWQVENLLGRIRQHPLLERRLFWAQGASDQLLEKLYAESDLLIAASYGEGFGLPLIEAAHHGLAILARDIPVFREVAGDYATYFSADTAAGLAQVLTTWQADWQQGRIISSLGMPYLNWQQSSEKWIEAMLSDQPLEEIALHGNYAFSSSTPSGVSNVTAQS